jgi:threonine/homoserine/homoserine lactone efflux protein
VIWSFLAVAVPLVLIPGASTAIVLRNSLAGGTRAGIETAAGVNGGSVAYGTVSAFGLAVAMHRWPSWWEVLRWAGTIYLGWLGLRALLSAARPRRLEAVKVDEATPRAAQPSLRNVYEGFLTNTFNPAIATFYLVIVPSFVPRDAPFARSVLLLTVTHVTIAFAWHVVWAIAGGTLARVLRGGRGRQLLELCTGTALIALALRLALQH